jgi:hypothetical protein
MILVMNVNKDIILIMENVLQQQQLINMDGALIMIITYIMDIAI